MDQELKDGETMDLDTTIISVADSQTDFKVKHYVNKQHK